jgi:hypothetical protein
MHLAWPATVSGQPIEYVSALVYRRIDLNVYETLPAA